VCFINYVLVHPDYHGRGIAGHLLEMVKEAYKSYLYINVMIGDTLSSMTRIRPTKRSPSHAEITRDEFMSALCNRSGRNFTPQQVADLFLSVRWVVGKYPDRLHKALMNSSRVISAEITRDEFMSALCNRSGYLPTTQRTDRNKSATC